MSAFSQSHKPYFSILHKPSIATNFRSQASAPMPFTNSLARSLGYPKTSMPFFSASSAGPSNGPLRARPRRPKITTFLGLEGAAEGVGWENLLENEFHKAKLEECHGISDASRKWNQHIYQHIVTCVSPRKLLQFMQVFKTHEHG